MIEMGELSYSHAYWTFLLPAIGVCADIVTGWIQASVNGTWDSTKMRKGLYRKSGELLLVVLAWAGGYGKAHLAVLMGLDSLQPQRYTALHRAILFQAHHRMIYKLWHVITVHIPALLTAYIK